MRISWTVIAQNTLQVSSKFASTIIYTAQRHSKVIHSHAEELQSCDVIRLLIISLSTR